MSAKRNIFDYYLGQVHGDFFIRGQTSHSTLIKYCHVNNAILLLAFFQLFSGKKFEEAAFHAVHSPKVQ